MCLLSHSDNQSMKLGYFSPALEGGLAGAKKHDLDPYGGSLMISRKPIFPWYGKEKAENKFWVYTQRYSQCSYIICIW